MAFDAGVFAAGRVLLAGAFTGLVFGFILQKAGMTRSINILRQFLLEDFTMVKVMVTAIVVGGVGVLGLHQAGLVTTLHVKATLLGANVLGGVLFGVGMAVLGLCPGTAIAAIGEGNRDAVIGVLGGIAGAGLYAETHPWFVAHVLPLGAWGKLTLPSMTGLPWGVWMAVFALVAVLLVRRLPGTAE
ncbi:hypothetical protein TBR22_A21950 [Luteitalea sp. TBR-22]|uniref:YeeE/YedE thiosulfate transporter family protein n=1 Tax=Luteitalea sp. TBR-22 TaxID=2802971 RepID=UPI001AF0E63B|nr:YeeE/YedE thiosulfate transporter family protein [Luteitalea sp. TBR-22]BCS32971.1 hypothetical protein TBR22_A21950 [Luteitalea sp. TBR-22]